jgi:hypothetical protein
MIGHKCGKCEFENDRLDNYEKSVQTMKRTLSQSKPLKKTPDFASLIAQHVASIAGKMSETETEC